MELVEIDNKKPMVHKDCYIDPRAILIGEVIVEEGVGIWPGVVVRADDAMVVIKRGAMILENAVIEAAKGRSMVIGAKSIISHGAIVHGADIGNHSIVGIGAIVLDDAVVRENSIIGSGALVSPGKEIPSGKLVLGIPGKVVGDLTPQDLENSEKEWTLLHNKIPKYKKIRNGE
jgi:carbonic anhydrase/acetyltransferase-like protein (isoleucine patch superfamily)